MPFSPRWLVSKGRDEEAIRVLSRARMIPQESDLIQIEFLYASIGIFCAGETYMFAPREIKAQHIFEQRTSQEKFPDIQNDSFTSNLRLGWHGYMSLFQTR